MIRSSKFHDVQNALAKINIITFSSYEVKLTGLHKGHTTWRNKTSDLLPKTKIEILALDANQELIVKTILDASKTGEHGDGIIYVYKIDKLLKIRTGESGDAVLD